MRRFVASFLSLALLIFLADGFISCLDDTIISVSGIAALGILRGFSLLLVLGMSAVLFVVYAATPMLRLRLIWPLILFKPAGLLLLIYLSIYYFHHLSVLSLGISLAQLALGGAVLSAATDRFRRPWPIVREEDLGEASFRIGRLTGFVALVMLVLVPAVLAYLGGCAVLAVGHFSQHFLVLRPAGLSVCAKTYTRPDGRSVELVPMIHIAEPGFYEQVTAAVPTNGLVLLEGVTDQKHLLKYKLSYKRMASSLGLAEQQASFAPGPARARPADVDLAQFSPTTLQFLNLVSRIHAQGLTLDSMRDWVQKTQSPELLDQIWADLLTLRNDHLLGEIERALARTETVTVPWGAAHMPGLAKGLEERGFRLVQQQEFEVLRFQTIFHVQAPRPRVPSPP